MNEFHPPPRPPWLARRGTMTVAPPAGSGNPAALSETPARKLLRDHLQHGVVGRREAAAFALALTQPEAARAIADFFASRRRTGRGIHDAR
jgi:hypothetical protein